MSMDETSLVINILNGSHFSKEKIDWGKFILFTNENGLSGALYEFINSNNFSVPKKVKVNLSNWHKENLKRNMLLLGQLKIILSRCKDKVVVLKGFSILSSTGQGIGQRFLLDIDLLALKDFNLIVEELKGLGYEKKQDYSDYLQKKHFHHFVFHKDISGVLVSVELHHQTDKITSPFRIPTKQVSLLETSFLGVKILGFSPEDLLIHISTHVSYDNLFFYSIRDLYDVKLLIEKNKLSWSEVIDKSKKWNCSSFVYSVLFESSDLLGAGIPSQVLGMLKSNSHRHQLFFLKFVKKNIFKSRMNNFNKWFFGIVLLKNPFVMIRLLKNGLVFMFRKKFG